MTEVSASAPTIRLTFPDLGRDVVPETMTIGMELSSVPPACGADFATALHMEGWTLVLDQTAIAAMSTGMCTPSSAVPVEYDIRLLGVGVRDTLGLDLNVFPVADSVTTNVALPPTYWTGWSQSFRTAPAHAVGGVTLRLLALNGDFYPWSFGALIDASGLDVGSLDGQMSAPYSPRPELDVQLPAVLPDGAVAVRLVSNEWMRPSRTVLIPLGAPLADPVSAYVTSVYATLFERSPDAAGLATWTTALRSGTPYSAVSDAITSSTEFRTRLISAAYRRYLGRSPNQPARRTGLAGWRRGCRSRRWRRASWRPTRACRRAGGAGHGVDHGALPVRARSFSGLGRGVLVGEEDGARTPAGTRWRSASRSPPST